MYKRQEDAARARYAAAASGRLAPLDVKTLVGAELELIMKADPLAFERALADQVRPRDPVRAPVFLDTPAKTSFRSRPVHDGLSLETLAFRDAKVLFFSSKKQRMFLKGSSATRASPTDPTDVPRSFTRW